MKKISQATLNQILSKRVPVKPKVVPIRESAESEEERQALEKMNEIMRKRAEAHKEKQAAKQTAPAEDDQAIIARIAGIEARLALMDRGAPAAPAVSAEPGPAAPVEPVQKPKTTDVDILRDEDGRMTQFYLRSTEDGEEAGFGRGYTVHRDKLGLIEQVDPLGDGEPLIAIRDGDNRLIGIKTGLRTDQGIYDG